MMPNGIRTPSPVNLDCNLADSWRQIKQKWQEYATITQLQRQPDEYQAPLFLHTIGDAALQIYNRFRMLPREAENGVGMNRSARGGKCKAL